MYGTFHHKLTTATTTTSTTNTLTVVSDFMNSDDVATAVEFLNLHGHDLGGAFLLRILGPHSDDLLMLLRKEHLGVSTAVLHRNHVRREGVHCRRGDVEGREIGG